MFPAPLISIANDRLVTEASSKEYDLAGQENFMVCNVIKLRTL